MSKIPPPRIWTALLVTVGFIAVPPVQGQTAIPQRGVRDVTLAGADAPAPKPIGAYYALVIGNNNYRDLTKLQTAVNDAKAIAQILSGRYGFQTKVLVDATRADIMTALAYYRRTLDPSSNLVIYYAGHGHHDKETDRAYWLPVDAQSDNNANWISAADITDDVKAIPSLHVLIIADSCFSGALTRNAGVAINTRNHNALVAKMLRSKSRHLMSSGGDEPVADAGAVNHSVFAGALLESLENMEDPEFTAAALFQGVQERVAGGSEQTPQYSPLRNSGHDAGDFVFFRSKTTLSKKGIGLRRTWPKGIGVAVYPPWPLGIVEPSSPPKDTASFRAGEATLSAKALYKSGRYQEAFPLFRAAAEAGDGEAAAYLGAMYEDGQEGLAKDEAQAASWYRKAADAGNTRGMTNLGLLYGTGRGGLRKDEAQMVSWYRKAADAGDAYAMWFLGDIYETGWGGLAKDEAQALKWYRKAAGLGNDSAKQALKRLGR